MADPVKWIEWLNRLHSVTGTLALHRGKAPLAQMAAQLILVAHEMEEELVTQTAPGVTTAEAAATSDAVRDDGRLA